MTRLDSPDARSAISRSTALSVVAIEFIVLVSVRTSLGPRTGSGSSSKEPWPIDRARLVSWRSGRSVVQLSSIRISRLTSAVTATSNWVRKAAASAATAEASRFVDDVRVEVAGVRLECREEVQLGERARRPSPGCTRGRSSPRSSRRLSRVRIEAGRGSRPSVTVWSWTDCSTLSSPLNCSTAKSSRAFAATIPAVASGDSSRSPSRSAVPRSPALTSTWLSAARETRSSAGDGFVPSDVVSWVEPTASARNWSRSANTAWIVVLLRRAISLES